MILYYYFLGGENCKHFIHHFPRKTKIYIVEKKILIVHLIEREKNRLNVFIMIQ